MARGTLAEEKVFAYIKAYLDPGADWKGGMDNTAPDIVLSNGKIVEVKENKAQCGQFVASTITNYKYSDEIVAAFTSEKTLKDNDLCKKWVQNYYITQKNVALFGVYDKATDKVTLVLPQEFFERTIFSCTYRKKPSGTSTSTPKWAYKYIPVEWNCIEKGKYMIAQNPLAINQTVIGTNTKNESRRIWVDDQGRVKVKSETNNPTWIFSMKFS